MFSSDDKLAFQETRSDVTCNRTPFETFTGMTSEELIAEIEEWNDEIGLYVEPEERPAIVSHYSREERIAHLESDDWWQYPSPLSWVALCITEEDIEAWNAEPECVEISDCPGTEICVGEICLPTEDP